MAKTCKFCDPDFGKHVDDNSDDQLLDSIIFQVGFLGKIGIDLFAQAKGIEVYITRLKEDYPSINHVTKINYCPMCGRKLEEVTE